MVSNKFHIEGIKRHRAYFTRPSDLAPGMCPLEYLKKMLILDIVIVFWDITLQSLVE